MTRLPKSAILFILFLMIIPLNDVSMAKDSRIGSRVMVEDIRYWSNPKYTRVVITLEKKTGFKYRLLKANNSIKKPQRLFVDISNAVQPKKVKNVIEVNDGLLKKVRTGQHDMNTVRVVLDIDSIRDFRVFPLEGPYRIVIDVSADRDALPPPAPEGKMLCIVIDPGHGGKDPGAIGKKGLNEKTVNLKLAKRLREMLRKSLSGNIILTRESDIFVPLEERTAVANANNADIFLSIHVNANHSRKARGVETYYLNFTTDEEAIRVAARENATSPEHMSDLQFILNDLLRTAKTNESIRLAANIQESILTTLKEKYRRVKGNGIKGAPFYVLVGTDMPSVLVEVSFISNPEEEARLRTDAYINSIADGITRAVKQYINGKGISEL